MKTFRDVCAEDEKGKRYRIINDWTHTFVEELDRKEAIEKYGDCVYYGGYTSGYVEGGGFEVTVWLDCWK